MRKIKVLQIFGLSKFFKIFIATLMNMQGGMPGVLYGPDGSAGPDCFELRSKWARCWIVQGTGTGFSRFFVSCISLSFIVATRTLHAASPFKNISSKKLQENISSWKRRKYLKLKIQWQFWQVTFRDQLIWITLQVIHIQGWNSEFRGLLPLLPAGYSKEKTKCDILCEWKFWFCDATGENVICEENSKEVYYR